jgi:hypothetical protein
MRAAVVEYRVDRDVLGKLDTLAFVLADTEWRDFVQNCRIGTYDHKGPGQYYEAVYGPVSTFGYETKTDLEQLSFHTDAAIQMLNLVQVRQGTPWFP